MSPAQLAAAEKAISWLNASGVPYAVKLPTGIVGTLPVLQRAQPAERINWNAEFHHVDTIKHLEPGQTYEWLIDPKRREKFAAAVYAAAVTYIGKDKFVIAPTEGGIELLRVE